MVITDSKFQGTRAFREQKGRAMALCILRYSSWVVFEAEILGGTRLACTCVQQLCDASCVADKYFRFRLSTPMIKREPSPFVIRDEVDTISVGLRQKHGIAGCCRNCQCCIGFRCSDHRHQYTYRLIYTRICYL